MAIKKINEFAKTMDKKFLFQQELAQVTISGDDFRLAAKSTSESSGSHDQSNSLQWTDPDLFNLNNHEQDSALEPLGHQLDLHMAKQKFYQPEGGRKYNILICTDFVFPKFGGVETHGYQIAQCLIERGHKVCFLTNKF